MTFTLLVTCCRSCCALGRVIPASEDGGLPLGLVDGVAHLSEMSPSNSSQGDRLFLYSDGFLEQA